MNYIRISNALLDSTQLNGKEKILLICIMRFNPSFPSYTKLREMTGFERATISKTLKSLESKNFIERHRKDRKVCYEPHPKLNMTSKEYKVPDGFTGSNSVL